MKSPEAIINLFSQKGLKITPQRRLIFELLAEDESHPTAEELYQHVISRMPDVSQTTVYNTLRELVALGELAPVENLSEGGARFDTNTSNHHHLFCMHCHTLVDIERDFPDVQLALAEAKGYQIVKNQVTFYGVCQECQKI
ncbi:MAG: transcriptional repressor [Anaerolineales bacterium]